MKQATPFGSQGVNIRAFLADIRQNPLFQAFLKTQVLPNMPPPKPWQGEQSAADWAHNTGLREGYLLAFQQIGVNLNDIGTDQ